MTITEPTTMTKHYREKYAPRPHGKQMAHPPGGRDVLQLCDVVDALEQLVLDAEGLVDTAAAKEIALRLWAIEYGGMMA